MQTKIIAGVDSPRMKETSTNRINSLEIPSSAHNLLKETQFQDYFHCEELTAAIKQSQEPEVIWQKRFFQAIGVVSKFVTGKPLAKVNTLWYPFGGADIFVPFSIYPETRDLVILTSEKFGSVKELDQFFQNKNQNSIVSWSELFGYFDSIRAFGEFKCEEKVSGAGALLLARIKSTFPESSLEGLYGYNVMMDGRLEFLAESNDPDLQNVVVVIKDKGVTKKIWYCCNNVFSPVSHESYKNFAATIKPDAMLVKAAPKMWHQIQGAIEENDFINRLQSIFASQAEIEALINQITKDRCNTIEKGLVYFDQDYQISISESISQKLADQANKLIQKIMEETRARVIEQTLDAPRNANSIVVTDGDLSPDKSNIQVIWNPARRFLIRAGIVLPRCTFGYSNAGDQFYMGSGRYLITKDVPAEKATDVPAVGIIPRIIDIVRSFFD